MGFKEITRETHTVVERQLVASKWDGSKRVFVKCPEKLDNGSVVKLGKLNGDVYEATAPKKDTPLTQIAIITHPEIMDDERLDSFSDFYNEKGSIALAEILDVRNILGISKDGFDGEIDIDSEDKTAIVELQDGHKLKVVKTLTAGSTKVGEIIDFANGLYGLHYGI